MNIKDLRGIVRRAGMTGTVSLTTAERGIALGRELTVIPGVSGKVIAHDDDGYAIVHVSVAQIRHVLRLMENRHA